MVVSKYTEKRLNEQSHGNDKGQSRARSVEAMSYCDGKTGPGCAAREI